MSQHEKYMQISLNLAKRGVGNTATNPSVGCVIVRDNIIASGNTDFSGIPHAEQIALKRAGKNTKNADAYITLEPCNHFGKTPPCSELLIEAGIKRVFIGIKDPNPKAAGGIEKLQEAGIEVITGLMEREVRETLSGFLNKFQIKKPFVTLKIACSADEKIGILGEKKQITGDIAQKYSHILRYYNDAIMVANGTAINDNPKLDCRLPGLEKKSPIRIFIAGKRRVPNNFYLLQKSNQRTICFINDKTAQYSDIKHPSFSQIQAENINEVFINLAKKNIHNLLIEGGQKINSHLLKNNLIDRLIIIESNKKLGKNAISATINESLKEIARDKFKLLKIRNLGKDLLKIYEKI